MIKAFTGYNKTILHGGLSERSNMMQSTGPNWNNLLRPLVDAQMMTEAQLAAVTPEVCKTSALCDLNMKLFSLVKAGRLPVDLALKTSKIIFKASSLDHDDMWHLVSDNTHLSARLALKTTKDAFLASALSQPLIRGCVSNNRMAMDSALQLSLDDYEKSALSDGAFIKYYVLSGIFTGEQAAAILKTEMQASSLSDARMISLFRNGRLSIEEGLAIPLTDLDPSHLNSLDPQTLTQRQRQKIHLYSTFEAMDALQEAGDQLAQMTTEPMDISQQPQVIELAIHLLSKREPTLREKRELFLLMQPNTVRVASRMTDLEYKTDKTYEEARELRLYTHYCLNRSSATSRSIHIGFMLQREALLKSLHRQKTARAMVQDDDADDGDIREMEDEISQYDHELKQIYFELCMQVPLEHSIIYVGAQNAPSGGDVYAALRKQEADNLYSVPLQRQIDYTIRTKLVLYYLQEVHQVPSAALKLGTMPNYITEKVDLLRMGITKYFVDTCVDYSPMAFEPLVAQIQEKMKERAFTLNQPEKIMEFASLLSPPLMRLEERMESRLSLAR